MSHQVKQGSLKQSQEESEPLQNADLSDLKNLQEEKLDKPKEVSIKSSDLDLVMKTCRLQRQDAIDLMQKCNGDVRESIRYYLNE